MIEYQRNEEKDGVVMHRFFAERLDENQREWLEEVAKTTNSYIFVAGVVDPAVYEAELATLEA